MLIISRRKGQRIVIGHDLEVIVTDLSRSTVKLGIRAPSHTVVMRGEVRDSIEQANREALLTNFDEDSLLGPALVATTEDTPSVVVAPLVPAAKNSRSRLAARVVNTPKPEPVAVANAAPELRVARVVERPGVVIRRRPGNEG